MAKMRPKIAKMRPKMAKMTPKMAKMRPKMTKMRPKMAKMSPGSPGQGAFRRLMIFCQDQSYTRAKKWHQKISLIFFWAAPKSRYIGRDRPKIGVILFGCGF